MITFMALSGDEVDQKLRDLIFGFRSVQNEKKII